MAMHSSYATREPGRAEEFLARAYVPGVALSLPEDASRFRLAVERLDGGSFQLDAMEIAARSAFRYEPDQEYFVSTVGSGRLNVRQRGADDTFLPGDVALIGQPGVPINNRVADFRQGVVTVRVDALRAAADRDPDTPAPSFTSVRALSAGHARAWRRTVGFVATTLREDEGVVASPLIVGAAERLLAELVLAIFPNDALLAPTPRDWADARSPATLRRAIGFIEANADRDIGIGDIAGAARVSRRAVQQTFRRHLDTTPTAYLRRARLDAAHRELVEAEPGALTVTEVAYRWGFCSPSRFTERYRAAFGTTPSETLRR
jgi:AraC-like DNA-binding protein